MPIQEKETKIGPSSVLPITMSPHSDTTKRGVSNILWLGYAIQAIYVRAICAIQARGIKAPAQIEINDKSAARRQRESRRPQANVALDRS